MLALPHSTQKLDHIFSQMNLVKTDVRKQLSTAILDEILTIDFRTMKQMIQSANVSMYDHTK
ncbi:UNVERIFIED_CONTAM: hypothetical protein FKN15_051544 [Acipenser sinensis]